MLRRGRYAGDGQLFFQFFPGEDGPMDISGFSIFTIVLALLVILLLAMQHGMHR